MDSCKTESDWKLMMLLIRLRPNPVDSGRSKKNCLILPNALARVTASDPPLCHSKVLILVATTDQAPGRSCKCAAMESTCRPELEEEEAVAEVPSGCSII